MNLQMKIDMILNNFESYEEYKAYRIEQKRKSDEYYASLSPDEIAKVKLEFDRQLEADKQKAPLLPKTRPELWMNFLSSVEHQRDAHNLRLKIAAVSRTDEYDWIQEKEFLNNQFSQKIIEQAKSKGFYNYPNPDFEAEPFLADINMKSPQCYDALCEAIQINLVKRILHDGVIKYNFIVKSQRIVTFFFREGEYVTWEFVKMYTLANGRPCNTVGNDNSPQPRNSRTFNSSLYK